MVWVHICHNLYVVAVVCIKRVCDRLASETLHITAMIHVATITASDGPFMYAELCAEHVVGITAMIHVTITSMARASGCWDARARSGRTAVHIGPSSYCTMLSST